MKKIFIIFICLLVVLGCKNNEEKEIVVNPAEEKNIKRKEYYVCVVPSVNHDDYYVKESSNVNYNTKGEKTYSNSMAQTITETTDLDEEIKEEKPIEVSSSNSFDLVSMDVIEDNEEFIYDDNELVNTSESIETNNELEVPKEEINHSQNTIVSIKENNINQETQSEVIADNFEEVKHGYYSPSGRYLGNTNVKVIDVSHHQGVINWDAFIKESDCYGVILRIGYWKTLDKQFERNISEIKRLNIPYGIYLFSYASNKDGALTESNFTNEVINKYDLNPTLGIYYDIESWKTNVSSSDNITKDMYDTIVTTYINNIKINVGDNYNVGVYSGRWYAMNRLGSLSKSYVLWVAEYNSTCKYDGTYKMWQYTSKGIVPGIVGNVDISYLY